MLASQSENEVYPSIAAMMESAAATACRIAADTYGFTLDYTEQSIAYLDPILAQVAAVGGVDEERETKLWGAYFGETLCRLYSGVWDFTQYPGSAVSMPTVLVGGSQLYPLMKVFRRLHSGETERIADFYEKVRERLQAAPRQGGQP